jgi:ribulose bisphosphate carboxylase small subunit
MKKIIIVSFAVLIIGILIISGCTNSSENLVDASDSDIKILESHVEHGSAYVDIYVVGVAQNVGSSRIVEGIIHLDTFNKDHKKLGGGWVRINSLDPQEKTDFKVFIINLCSAGQNCEMDSYNVYPNDLKKMGV